MRLAPGQARMDGWPQKNGGHGGRRPVTADRRSVDLTRQEAVKRSGVVENATHLALRSKPQLPSTITRKRLLSARGSLRYSEWLGSGTRDANSTGSWTCRQPSAGLADACDGRGDGHCYGGVLASGCPQHPDPHGASSREHLSAGQPGRWATYHGVDRTRIGRLQI
jgi:hypothetical protein